MSKFKKNVDYFNSAFLNQKNIKRSNKVYKVNRVL